MASQLAKTVFQTGPKDILATLDIYKSAGKDIITSVQALSEPVSSLMAGVGQAQSAIGDFTNMAKNFSLDKNALADRLLAASSSFTSELRNLTKGAKDQIESALGPAKKLMCTVNDVKSMVNNFDIKNISSVGALINKVAGSDVFKAIDRGAIVGIYSSVIDQATKLGIPNAFGAIVGAIGDTRTLLGVANKILPGIIEQSDLNQFTSIANSPIGKLINVVNPGFCKALTGSYKMPSNGATKNSSSDFGKIISSLGKINPNWDKKLRSGDTGVALRALDILGGSIDFKKILHAGAASNVDPQPLDKFYCLASKYKEADPIRELSKNFPKLSLSALDKSAQQIFGITDPRTTSREDMVFSI